MKRNYIRCFVAIAFLGVRSNIARSEVALNASARNIEYAKEARKYLLSAAPSDNTTRSSLQPKGSGAYVLMAKANRSYKPLYPVVLLLTLKNNGTHAIVDCYRRSVKNYRFSVEAPNRKPALLTTAGHKIFDNPYGLALDFIFGEVRAKTKFTVPVQVNRYFDMTDKGTYKITVSQNVSVIHGGDVRSTWFMKTFTISAEPIFVIVE